MLWFMQIFLACIGYTTASTDEIRLVNGHNSCSGRVEVLYYGIWGTVCDDDWDLADAAVVCREMDCGNVIEAKSEAYFGQGSWPIWMDDVQCAGNESSLKNCRTCGWRIPNCRHDEDAGVICNLSVRLVNGDNSCSGRVEVLYNGTWGTVCDDDWDLSDAAVVCREMGCGNVIEAKSEAYFGQGSGQIWMDDVKCNGTESTLLSCQSNGRGIHKCKHSNDAGVICNVSVRLVNGDNSCSGRVEVLYNGTWGTLCDDYWDLSDAAVVCRELGCGSVVDASRAYFGQGSGPMWKNNVQCIGSESTLKSCRTNEIASCSNSKGAGVICQPPVLLSNGSHSCSGRVEVRHNGMWGTVCDDGWDLSDAAVVCREMDCGNVIEAKRGAYFGQGSGPIWMDNVQCAGTETSLKTCSKRGWGTHDCEHHKDAGVICNLSVRLVNGRDSCSGRVEVLYNGKWGTVCDDGWDRSDAAVVCREMGCGNVIEAKSAAYFGPGSGQIWMDDVNCAGNESSLRNCRTNGWERHDCTHYEDAGVICKSVRLVNGSDSCSGRVEVHYNGTWGTVCDDGWDLSDAAVVCREMGCGNATETKKGAFFGNGSGPIWMNNVNCYGNELSLKSCISPGWNVQNCSHYKDAGVICQYGNLSSTTAITNSTTEEKSTAADVTSSLGNNSYHFTYINESKSWIDALGYCKTHHQTLVHILNATAQAYITQMLQGKEIPNGAWIGLERSMLFTCSPWLWTGGPYVDYASWHQTYPVDRGSRFCGKLLKDEKNVFGWVDACCHKNLPFFCQG